MAYKVSLMSMLPFLHKFAFASFQIHWYAILWMEFMEKFFNTDSTFFGFQLNMLRFYHLHVRYTCIAASGTASDGVTNYVTHRIFSTNL